ncbi:hypothetical protein GCM10017557_24640 [Streptomyces aurantiacus]|uniref:Uncharacterized protein n=1 Tax=Streptomyces aurantiacus TaxID=47760 RepID=A0A7G1P3E6_9ACTN|nr:hypothetical protein GCM10017557_24640 [Streptomyces aurantiacus]
MRVRLPCEVVRGDARSCAAVRGEECQLGRVHVSGAKGGWPEIVRCPKIRVRIADLIARDGPAMEPARGGKVRVEGG